MPPKQPASSAGSATRAARCTAHTAGGQPCRKAAVPGLTVCKTHGGGTAASVRIGKEARVSQRAAVLWGISEGTGSVSVKEELRQLARNKMADVLALRIKLSEDNAAHIGMLVEGREVSEADDAELGIKTSKKQIKKSGVSPWVTELHRAENELLSILKALHEIEGNTTEVDVARIRLQTARQVASILKAFPGISIDEVAREVSKGA